MSIDDLITVPIEADLETWLRRQRNPLEAVINAHQLSSTLAEQIILGSISEYVIIDGPLHLGIASMLFNGVSIFGPIIIGDNCTIGPHTFISRHSYIGSGVHISHGVYIRNSILLNGSRIGCGSYISNAIIGTNTIIGPHAQIGHPHNFPLPVPNAQSFSPAEYVAIEGSRILPGSSKVEPLN
jgi:UDP-N-acetylglucosamine diphosphorylase / glucose-1-phosphate thymidylyltransferase / UDP-N-acetylgalactosamine diphosphorylase / glucosamine-1-phosphate N-acetyltransferase / galactosamine-1-phosphate N-acetyltransferase